MDVKSINPNPTSFKALLNLIGDKSCLPKGATKRLQKLVQPIGTNTDIITIGVYKEEQMKHVSILELHPKDLARVFLYHL